MVDEDDKKFENALAQVLRPLARSMITKGVTIAQATELLKQAYVSAALQMEADAPSDSRISLLTGIHRKDVKRLRETDPRPPRRPMRNAASLAIAVWRSDPSFNDSTGNPLELARSGDPGFDELIKKARIDLPASVMLDALIEQGLVVQGSEADMYRLSAPDASIGLDQTSKIMAFEKNLSAHLEATASNLASVDSPHFERAAHFNQLSPSSIARLEEEAGQKLQALLEDINAIALGLQDEDADENQIGRISIGGYIFGENKAEGGEDGTK